MQAFLKGSKITNQPSTNKDKSATQQRVKKAPIPWVEKYRPRTVDDVAYQDEVVAVLKKCLQGADLPNLLFYGPPGTGKTSTILAAAKELFGDMYRNRILELNASDERGIQVIRDKVKTFAQLTASATRPDGRPCPPFKIIILDEADSMTSSAQAALRRTMEKESKTTRFCLLCNYVSRIIEPLTSRCSKFRFKPLSRATLIERLKWICDQESIVYDEDALEKLVKVSEGDLRKAITLLQSAHRLKGSDGVKAVDICEIAGVIDNHWITELIETCKTNSYEKLESYVTDMLLEGHSAYQLISQLHDEIISKPDYSDKKRSIICEKIAVCDHRLLEGADEYLQIMDLCSAIMHTICH